MYPHDPHKLIRRLHAGTPVRPECCATEEDRLRKEQEAERQEKERKRYLGRFAILVVLIASIWLVARNYMPQIGAVLIAVRPVAVPVLVFLLAAYGMYTFLKQIGWDRFVAIFMGGLVGMIVACPICVWLTATRGG